MSSFPRAAHAHDVDPLVGKAEAFPRLTAASWRHTHHSGSVLLHLYSLGVQQRGSKGANSADNDLARKRSQLHLNQPSGHSTPHHLGVYLTQSARGRRQVEMQFGCGSFVTTVKYNLVQFSCFIARQIQTSCFHRCIYFKPRRCLMWATSNLFDLQHLCLSLGSFPFSRS